MGLLSKQYSQIQHMKLSLILLNTLYLLQYEKTAILKTISKQFLCNKKTITWSVIKNDFFDGFFLSNDEWPHCISVKKVIKNSFWNNRCEWIQFLHDDRVAFCLLKPLSFYLLFTYL